MQKLKNILYFIKKMGISWLLFRIIYLLKMKGNWFDRKNHIIIKKAKKFTDLNKTSLKKPTIVSPLYISHQSDQGQTDAITKHIILGFSHLKLDYSQSHQCNWYMNPLTKKNTPHTLSWNKIPDFGDTGDIKLVWEASRFNQVADIINSFSLTKDKQYAELFERHCSDWVSQNRFPYGVHYKCGQEIAIRLFNWFIGLDYFYDYLSEPFKQKIHKEIYISLLRIEINISYAAKSVRNNHIISEATGLLIGGWLFSYFPESNRWIKTGLDLLIDALAYQVYSDGAYIQHSMTYQRLVLDTLSFVILIAQKKNITLPTIIHESHHKTLIFLYSHVQKNGHLPNYGSNDGAYLFRLSSLPYRNFKPSLNLASALIHQSPLFKDGQELIQFFGIPTKKAYATITKHTIFDDGGYYILKNDHFFIMCRCHSYKHRPSQIDMLHIDIWHGNKNIFCDTGTYSYNTNSELKETFIGVQGHNTMRINQKNHMEPILNFGLTNWTRSKLIKKTASHFIGEHYGYQQKFKITHRREIILEPTKITIIDSIFPIKKSLFIEQIFNSPYPIKKETSHRFTIHNMYSISSSENGVLSENNISVHYHEYKKGYKLHFEKQTKTDLTIKTMITLN